MVAWNKTKGKAASDRKQIERYNISLGDNKVRLIGDVLPRYAYWVTTNEGKKFPVECLRFNRETEEMDDTTKDPFTELPADVYEDKPQFAYVCNVIDRKDGSIKLFDLKATIYKQIVDYATNSDYGNPADPEKGYDITIKKEKTGPLAQNVKYSVMPARSNSPLTEEEKALELYELDKLIKRPTYVDQKKWLMQNTALFAHEAGDEFQAEQPEDLE